MGGAGQGPHQRQSEERELFNENYAQNDEQAPALREGGSDNEMGEAQIDSSDFPRTQEEEPTNNTDRNPMVQNSGVGEDAPAGARPPADNDIHLLEEVTALRERLFDLERQARPKLNAASLETDWKRDLDKLGPGEAALSWKKGMQQRRVALLLDNATYTEGRSWLRRIEVEVDRRIKEDLEYNTKLLKLRKEWERKNSVSRKIAQAQREGKELDIDKSDEDSHGLGDDSDTSEAASEFYGDRQRLLQRNYEYEKKALEVNYRMRKKRQARRMESRRARRPAESSSRPLADMGGGSARPIHQPKPSQIPTQNPFASPKISKFEASADYQFPSSPGPWKQIRRPEPRVATGQARNLESLLSRRLSHRHCI